MLSTFEFITAIKSAIIAYSSGLSVKIMLRRSTKAICRVTGAFIRGGRAASTAVPSRAVRGPASSGQMALSGLAKGVTDEMPLIADVHKKCLADGESSELRGVSAGTDRVCVQHNLDTILPLYRAMLAMGADPGRIQVAGKCYSTHPPAQQALRGMGLHVHGDWLPDRPGEYSVAVREQMSEVWDEYERRTRQEEGSARDLITMDEGGKAIGTMPPHHRIYKNVVGIEQTTAGLYSSMVRGKAFPLISVAGSAAKRLIEAPLIAEVIAANLLEKLKFLDAGRRRVFGIVGLGALGSRMLERLIADGHYVIVYDADPVVRERYAKEPSCSVASSISVLASNVDVVCGFTGKDISRECDFSSSRDVVLCSGSSGDIEFNQLLVNAARSIGSIQVDPLSDLSIRTTEGGTVKVLHGGYPLNFSGQGPCSVPAEKIAVTRAMMAFADTQALQVLRAMRSGDWLGRGGGQILMLAPEAQDVIAQYAFGRWPDLYDERTRALFSSLEAIKEYSEGSPQCDFIRAPGREALVLAHSADKEPDDHELARYAVTPS